MDFNQTDEFKKDLKRLTKKWRSVPKDVEEVEETIAALYVDREGVDRQEFRASFFNGKRASILQSSEGYEVVKMRLDVESLGTSSKARIIFVAVIFSGQVYFIELYAKNEKPREDKGRIEKCVKTVAG